MLDILLTDNAKKLLADRFFANKFQYYLGISTKSILQVQIDFLRVPKQMKATLPVISILLDFRKYASTKMWLNVRNLCFVYIKMMKLTRGE